MLVFMATNAGVPHGDSFVTYTATFLRNSRCGEPSCIDQSKAHLVGAPPKTLEYALAIPGLVVIRARIDIGEPEAKCVVKEDGELACRRGDSLGFPDSGRETAVERTECGLVFPIFTATMRSTTVTPLENRRVFELSTFPLEIVLPGARVSQDVKCFAVGHLLMSSPHSAI